jgi:Domain of unknown function (DUF222)
MSPGPELARLLASLDRADVDDVEIVEHVKAWERLLAWAAAGQINALTEFARRRPTDPTKPVDQHGHLDVDEFAADEIALALTLSPLTAQRRLGTAVTTSERLPAALDALARGHIDYSRLNTFHDETDDLTDEQAARLAQELLDQHASRPLTNGQLKHRLKRRALRERSTAENEKKHRDAAARRHDVTLHNLGDGTSELRATLAPQDGATAMAILDSAAHHARSADDTRTLGQRRAAALMDLLTGRIGARCSGNCSTTASSDPSTVDKIHQADGRADTDHSAHGGHGHDDTPRGGPQHRNGDSTSGEPPTSHSHGVHTHHRGAASSATPIVNVTIAYSEFLRLADHLGLTLLGHRTEKAHRASLPGEIESLGAVPGWVVRDLVSDVLTTPGTGFRAVIYDDTTGQLKGMSSTRYIPPKAMADHVRHHDITCRFPGCRRTARRCDIDHAHPWNHGGITENCNLQCLCRHHHRLKQNPAWRVRYHNGTSQWTAPTGHTYTSWPHDWRDPNPPDDLTQDHPPVEEPPPDDLDPGDGGDRHGLLVRGETLLRHEPLDICPPDDEEPPLDEMPPPDEELPRDEELPADEEERTGRAA